MEISNHQGTVLSCRIMDGRGWVEVKAIVDGVEGTYAEFPCYDSIQDFARLTRMGANVPCTILIDRSFPSKGKYGIADDMEIIHMTIPVKNRG